MKKLLLILFVLTALFASVIPARADQNPYDGPVRFAYILAIDETRRVIAVDKICYPEICFYISLYVAENARISIPGQPGLDAFEDLQVGQYIACHINDDGIATGINVLSGTKP